MKQAYLFLSTLLLSFDDKLFVDLYRSNYGEDVITTPSVLIDLTNTTFRNYKKNVLMGEIQGKLYYIQDEYTDSHNQSSTQEHSLKILENVQNLISKLYLANDEYFSQLNITSVEQVSEVTNQNIFVINFNTTFLLQREKEEKIFKTITIKESLTY